MEEEEDESIHNYIKEIPAIKSSMCSSQSSETEEEEHEEEESPRDTSL